MVRRIFKRVNQRAFSNWQGYFLAVVLVAIISWLKYLAQPNIIHSDVPVLYMLAIVPTAVFFGLGPSLFACFLSLAAFNFFFIPPANHFVPATADYFSIMAIFLAIGVIISLLSADLRQKKEEATREVSARRQSEAELREYRNHLENLVKQRTEELEKVNLYLQQDITERKQLEETLKRYTGELEGANMELEAFSYSVSHDLKAPLRSLDGFSEIILEDYGDKLDKTGRDYLDRIRKTSQYMSGLIDNMLKLSHISGEDMHPDMANLSAIAKSIMEELRDSQPERQAEFVISPDIVVHADRNLLTILLRNLLENAWKYTGKCPQTRIELGVTQTDAGKVYFIKDNGAGFDMKYADRLFQPFQRLHSEKEYAGTGIGLAIVQRIVRRHGGKVWAESEKGRSTTFYFTLG